MVADETQVSPLAIFDLSAALRKFRFIASCAILVWRIRRHFLVSVRNVSCLQAVVLFSQGWQQSINDIYHDFRRKIS
jgi:hypothetical protein